MSASKVTVCLACGQRPKVAAALPVMTTNPYLEKMLEDAAARKELGYRYAPIGVGGYVHEDE